MSRGIVRGGGGRTRGDLPPPPGARRLSPPRMGSTPPEKNKKTLCDPRVSGPPVCDPGVRGHLPPRHERHHRLAPLYQRPAPMGKRVYPQICKKRKSVSQAI
ncbi:hypothetical protein Taro_050665 [Colocasia esculenta]|uniref:Uncharacterized protein n=1 Tax=Colocasia esculenta TaxID=4460 RepID=A0A843XEN3_COLES|nr:hypothetical protein [Colocasia esculenta]